jgi:hypothetical protein
MNVLEDLAVSILTAVKTSDFALITKSNLNQTLCDTLD